jgi:hypothetical protein
MSSVTQKKVCSWTPSAAVSEDTGEGALRAWPAAKNGYFSVKTGE